jgi:hypothetical protein
MASPLKIPDYKIVQLIPAAPGWYISIFILDKDGKTEVRDGMVCTVKKQIAAWALCETGDVVPMVEGDWGLCFAHESSMAHGGDGSFQTYEPREATGYALEWHKSSEEMVSPRPDWEAIAISADPDGQLGGAYVLWRGPSQ